MRTRSFHQLRHAFRFCWPARGCNELTVHVVSSSNGEFVDGLGGLGWVLEGGNERTEKWLDVAVVHEVDTLLDRTDRSGGDLLLGSGSRRCDNLASRADLQKNQLWGPFFPIFGRLLVPLGAPLGGHILKQMGGGD